MKKIKKAEAEIFLSDVFENHKFYASCGEVYSNIEELIRGLRKMKKKDFEYHVNSEKNDFANWIYDCIGDVELANLLRKTTKKSEAIKIIKERITYLKKIVGV